MWVNVRGQGVDQLEVVSCEGEMKLDGDSNPYFEAA